MRYDLVHCYFHIYLCGESFATFLHEVLGDDEAHFWTDEAWLSIFNGIDWQCSYCITNCLIFYRDEKVHFLLVKILDQNYQSILETNNLELFNEQVDATMKELQGVFEWWHQLGWMGFVSCNQVVARQRTFCSPGIMSLLIGKCSVSILATLECSAQNAVQ